MKVTGIRMKSGEWGKVRAFATITFDNSFAVSGVKVIEGKNGLFVAMASKKDDSKAEYNDIFYPVTAEFREYLIEEVLKEYNKGEVETPGDEVNPDDFAAVEDDDEIPF